MPSTRLADDVRLSRGGAAAMPGRAPHRVRIVDALALLAFLTLVAIGAATHELAHDEAQAWNIARTARWPWQVPFLNRYEGHPPFWTVLLWPFTLTGDPRWLQGFSAVLAASAVALLLLDGPFPARVRLLVPFGAYPLYDYAVLARPYGMALVVAALLATVLRRGSGRLLVPAVLCGVLAATSAFGIVLSVPLAAFAYVECARRRPPPVREIALACFVYGGLALAAGLAVLLPVVTNEFEQTMRAGERVRPSAVWLTAATNAFPHFRTLPFGLGQRLWQTPALYAAVTGVGVLAFVAVGVRLRAAPHALAAWVVAALGTAGLAAYTSTTEERYLGHVFVAALTLLWATDASRGPARVRTRPDRAADALLVAVLIYHALIGAASIGYDVLNERTPWRRAAATIGPVLEDDGAVVLNDYGYAAVTLLAWLDRPAVDLDCGGCVTRFSRWDVVERADRRHLRASWCALERRGQPVVAITPSERFADVPGVQSIGEWGPGQRDWQPRSAKALRLVDPSALCAPGAGPARTRGPTGEG